MEKISKVKDNVKNEPEDEALLEVNILYYFKIALKSLKFTYTNIYNNFLYLCYLVNHEKCSKTATKYKHIPISGAIQGWNRGLHTN